MLFKCLSAAQHRVEERQYVKGAGSGDGRRTRNEIGVEIDFLCPQSDIKRGNIALPQDNFAFARQAFEFKVGIAHGNL